jgi:hypothetical protein
MSARAKANLIQQLLPTAEEVVSDLKLLGAGVDTLDDEMLLFDMLDIKLRLMHESLQILRSYLLSPTRNLPGPERT